MSYRSTCIHDLGANFIIEGWLTLHGVVRFVPLELEIVRFVTDTNGDTRAGFEAAATITRSDFGIDIDVIRRWTVAGWSSPTRSRSKSRSRCAYFFFFFFFRFLFLYQCCS